MNAIVALCHFCEQHGPAVVMCTQPYRHAQSRTQPIGTVDYSVETNSMSRNASHIGLYGIGTGEMGPATDSTTNAFLCNQGRHRHWCSLYHTVSSPLSPLILFHFVSAQFISVCKFDLVLEAVIDKLVFGEFNQLSRPLYGF